MSATYIPYDNLSIDWKKEGKAFSLTLPWTQLDIEIEEPEKEWVIDAISSLRTKPNAANVQKFLDTLKEHNVAYRSARNENEITHLSIDSLPTGITAKFETPKDLAETINQEAALGLLFPLPQTWEWPLEDILRQSKVAESEAYDPFSLITLLIGKRLEAESLTEQARQELPHHLDELRIRNEDKFFEHMKALLRQTHYITSRFEECVLPSLRVFSQAKPEIEAFIAEEKGHDRLMANALKDLGCVNPTSIAPFPGVVLLMDLFKYASQISPLAFTLMIGFFEGSHYGKSDPLADILASSSRPAAAKGYAIHYEINKNSKHCDVIMELAGKLNLQTKEAVEFAVRVLELATLLGGIADRSLVTTYEV